MKCTEHGADGCATCKPAIHAAWTAGQLKAALAGLPDGTPLAVNAAGPEDPYVADQQVIVGAGFGTVDWGDGYGPEPTTLFGLDCEWPEDLLWQKPDRPCQTPAPGDAVPSPFTRSRRAASGERRVRSR